jgi:hypothetical protein
MTYSIEFNPKEAKKERWSERKKYKKMMTPTRTNTLRQQHFTVPYSPCMEVH